MGVYFMLWIIIKCYRYSFSCSNCYSFNHWEFFRASSCVLSKSLDLLLSTSLPSGRNSPGLWWIFPAPVPESTMSLKSWEFYWTLSNYIPETSLSQQQCGRRMGTGHGGRQTRERPCHNSELTKARTRAAVTVEMDLRDLRGWNDSSCHQPDAEEEGGIPKNPQVSPGESGSILTSTVNEGQPIWGRGNWGSLGLGRPCSGLSDRQTWGSGERVRQQHLWTRWDCRGEGRGGGQNLVPHHVQGQTGRRARKGDGTGNGTKGATEAWRDRVSRKWSGVVSTADRSRKIST